MPGECTGRWAIPSPPSTCHLPPPGDRPVAVAAHGCLGLCLCLSLGPAAARRSHIQQPWRSAEAAVHSAPRRAGRVGRAGRAGRAVAQDKARKSPARPAPSPSEVRGDRRGRACCCVAASLRCCDSCPAVRADNTPRGRCALPRLPPLHTSPATSPAASRQQRQWQRQRQRQWQRQWQIEPGAGAAAVALLARLVTSRERQAPGASSQQSADSVQLGLGPGSVLCLTRQISAI